MKAQLATLLALALGASTAMAGDNPKFDEVNKDGDGRITKQEASGELKSNFSDVDRDGNGHITATEYTLGARKGSGK